MSNDDERRFAFELAHLLGYSGPDALLAKIGEAEWETWKAWWEVKRNGA